MKSALLLSFLILSFAIAGCEEDETPEISTIDLVAESINFSVVPTSEFEGVVTIVGTVKNYEDDFISSSGQQEILLYEIPAGFSEGSIVATRDFADLTAGDSLQVSFSRNWSKSAEFTPNYRLMILFEPDIAIDDNPRNDDSDASNNRLDESGSQINDLF